MHAPFVDKSPHRRGSAGAGSWLKHRLAQILTRSSCTAAASSDTAFVSLAKKASVAEEAPRSPYFCTPCTYERPKLDGVGDPHSRRRRRRSRSASLVHISVDCTGGAASGRRSVHSDAPLLQQRPSSLPVSRVDGAKKQSKPAARLPSASRRHCSSTSDAWGRARRPRSTSTLPPYHWSSSSSSSSTATDDELAPFSSAEGGGGEEEAETRTLFSSLSFSSDSTSEFYQTYYSGGNSTRTRRGNTARPAPRRASLPRTGGGPASAGAFRPLISVETKKHGGCNDRKKEEKGANVKKQLAGAEEEAGPGMPVVKRSSNPYADFRSSMVEMVVERRISSVEQMEELLSSYLSLNSPRLHPDILAAFEDVWEAVFGEE